MFKIIFTFALIILFNGCIHQSSLRTPASYDDVLTSLPELINLIERDFNEQSCTTLLLEQTDLIFKKKSHFFFPQSQPGVEHLIKSGLQTTQTIFNLRNSLQRKFKEFRRPSVDCVAQVRKSLRYIRFAEETLIDWLAVRGVLPAFSSKPIFADLTFPHVVLADEKRSRFSVQTGDVLLMRGQSFVSAAIARSGDVDAQFSHLAIVGEDRNEKKYVVETLIETGAKVIPLDEYFMKSGSRIVIYRHKNQEMARRAGQFIFQKVNERYSKKQNIPYDFTMNPVDHSQLFCAELVRWAFEEASQKQLILPTYETSFEKLYGSQFLKDISMNVKSTFAPADMEIEPNFEFIAEWRNVETLRKIKIQDAIFTAFYDWMIERKYQFQADLSSWSVSKIAIGIRSLGFITDKMQPHMQSSTVKAMLRLKKFSEIVEAKIFPIEQKYHQDYGYAMSFVELLAELENIRKQDEELYLNPPQRFSKVKEGHIQPLFHSFYRPY